MRAILILFGLLRSGIRWKKFFNPNFKGKEFWQPIKQLTKPFDRRFKCQPLTPVCQYYLGQLNEYLEDGTVDETAHFAIQVDRLTKSGTINFREFMQLALNIGQLQATLPELAAEWEEFLMIDWFVKDETLIQMELYLMQTPGGAEALEKLLNYLS
jgi:hypothetical protein